MLYLWLRTFRGEELRISNFAFSPQVSKSFEKCLVHVQRNAYIMFKMPDDVAQRTYALNILTLKELLGLASVEMLFRKWKLYKYLGILKTLASRMHKITISCNASRKTALCITCFQCLVLFDMIKTRTLSRYKEKK